MQRMLRLLCRAFPRRPLMGAVLVSLLLAEGVAFAVDPGDYLVALHAAAREGSWTINTSAPPYVDSEGKKHCFYEHEPDGYQTINQYQDNWGFHHKNVWAKPNWHHLTGEVIVGSGDACSFSVGTVTGTGLQNKPHNYTEVTP